MKRIMRSFATIGLACCLSLGPAAYAFADDAPVLGEGASGTTRGPRCTFTRPEKWGMLLWLVPIAGAIYTPFACKRTLFKKGKR